MPRLIDIEVDEVSYVDKAANKRKFLFIKRDESDEGGNNLELLKQLKGNKEVIEALEAIHENLNKFGLAIEKALSKKDLTEEAREKLLEKKEEFEDLKEEIEEGVEELFLDKSSDDEDESEDEVESKKEEVAPEVETKKQEETAPVNPPAPVEKKEETTPAPIVETKKEEQVIDQEKVKEGELLSQIMNALSEFDKESKEFKEMIGK